MLEQQAPDAVQPADKCTKEGDDDCCDQSDDVLGLKKGWPSDTNLNNPVDERDEEKDDLDETWLLVEPIYDCCHFFSSI